MSPETQVEEYVILTHDEYDSVVDEIDKIKYMYPHSTAAHQCAERALRILKDQRRRKDDS